MKVAVFVGKERLRGSSMIRAERIVEGFGTCTGCDKTAMLANGLCWKCWDEEADRLYREDLPISVVEKLPVPQLTVKPSEWGKGGARVDKSVPTSDGVVMIDKRGVKYRVQSGRKRTGEWRNCIDCGKPIFVRSHRKGPTQGKRCAPCNRKVYLPPVRVKEGSCGSLCSSSTGSLGQELGLTHLIE